MLTVLLLAARKMDTPALSSRYRAFVALVAPEPVMARRADGEVVPMPTLPDELILICSVMDAPFARVPKRIYVA
ncbi:hypothetical protein A2949_03240 [Candidatus Adlerbacteria bacterium RIFCSPLOWO2_01_FULL_54_21b]|uniref:Uncharacterized protein n=1 Tax=Candidatus Adlerbacteria bacterium RIFCSPLOWO2_01_FULL_54_21b TaxID=1797245 RepID=A0A1F4XXH5_9BACT|nr:MAG: hypothetical protein A2949_03240 [Candidatus Adlerbacteria bacterium RIFCSPLOWO2_01_FULL_54_21b]